MSEHSESILKDECYKIVGACMEVHSVLGPGFHESIYQEALAIELSRRSIPFEKEKDITVTYKDVVLSKFFKADFVCYGQIIIELKALSGLTNDHVSQILNYLKATNLRVGLLINFGTRSLEHEKYVK